MIISSAVQRTSVLPVMSKHYSFECLAQHKKNIFVISRTSSRIVKSLKKMDKHSESTKQVITSQNTHIRKKHQAPSPFFGQTAHKKYQMEEGTTVQMDITATNPLSEDLVAFNCYGSNSPQQNSPCWYIIGICTSLSSSLVKEKVLVFSGLNCDFQLPLKQIALMRAK